MKPTSRETVLSTLEAHADEWRGLGVVQMSLFGSFARGEATAESDIDICVELSRPTTYRTLFELKERLEEVLGRPVDLVTRRGAQRRPRLHARIEREALRVA